MRIRCITNRHLISETDYFRQIERIVQAKPEAVIVREKDLTEPSMSVLPLEVMRICETYQVPCILHTFVHTAIRLRADAIHLPLKDLMVMTEEEKVCFRVIGASTHSAEEALAAENAGATYITASHIYATDCKKGLTPKRYSIPAGDLPNGRYSGLRAWRDLRKKCGRVHSCRRAGSVYHVGVYEKCGCGEDAGTV